MDKWAIISKRVSHYESLDTGVLQAKYKNTVIGVIPGAIRAPSRNQIIRVLTGCDFGKDLVEEYFASIEKLNK